MPRIKNYHYEQKNLKAIIFDMDGVLIDSMPYHILGWKYAFKKFGILPSNNDLYLLEGMSSKETVDFILKKYHKKLNPGDKEKIYSLKQKKLEKSFPFYPYPYVLTLLKLLKKHQLKLALVSGANKKFVQKVVKKFFLNLFDVIINGNDTKRGKPNPAPYLIAIKKLKCSPKEILVIENAPLGIASAKKAGLKTYVVKTTLNKKFLRSSDKIFDSHKELLREIKNIILD